MKTRMRLTPQVLLKLPVLLVSYIVVAGLTIALVPARSGPPPPPSPVPTPAKVCQQPKLAGLGYGPYHTGQDPRFAISPSAEEVDADIPTLACLTTNIRIYSSLGPAKDIVQDAGRVQLSVNLGIWLGRDIDANEREMAAGMELMSSKAVGTVTVGNEVLLRHDLTEEQLRADIRRIHDAAVRVGRQGHSVQVTTADVPQSWRDHPQLASDVDFVTVHIYPFWEMRPISDAIKFIDDSYSEMLHKFAGKKIVIGETGWPSAGPAWGGAVPSGASQARYFRDFVEWARHHNVDYYYFDAFDESWKTDEHDVGTHWGLYGEDGVLKPDLRDVLPAASPQTLDERSFRDIVVGTPTVAVAASPPVGFDIGIDTSGQQRHWLTVDPDQGTMTLQYPDQQTWGTMFITVGKAVPPGNRPSVDLSQYRSLTADMRWAGGGDSCVHLGVKDSTQLDDGSETTVRECLTDAWSTIRIPLNVFAGADLSHLYVAFEVVFADRPMTVQLRNVRYSSHSAPWPSIKRTPAPAPITGTQSGRPLGDIYVGSLEPGLDIGIDTSNHRFGWLTTDQGTLTLQYPDQQIWGTMFITVGKAVPPGNRPSIDLSRYRSLTADMRWAGGGDGCIHLGLKDRTQQDDGTETTVRECLTGTWSTIRIPLNAFTGADLSHLYVVFEVIFGNQSMSIQLRNIRYSSDEAPLPPAPAPVPTPTPRPLGDIYVGSLEPGLDIGIDTSNHRFGWLTADQATLTLLYPDQQIWGAMSITVGKAVPPGNRPGVDLSHYRSLTADVRWGGGGDGCVHLGVKDSAQPDDGSETTVPECLTGTWSTIRIPLRAFTGADLSRLYVVFEVVFGNQSMSIQLRNIRYSTDDAPLPPTPTPAPTPTPRPLGDIYVGSLEPGLDIGIDTSNHRFGWLTADQGTLTLQYPDQQLWGAMFITVGKAVPPGNRPSVDLSRYHSLTADMRWAGGGDGCVHLGVKDSAQQDGTETTVPECLTGTWSTVGIPLNAFTGADLSHLYVVFEVVFADKPMTIELRNIRYSAT